MRRAAWLVLLVGAAVAGCAHRATSRDALPAASYQNDAEAFQILRQRAAAVKTVSARGTIIFVRPDGESVRMDLAMASQPPDHLRLRAWKFGRAIFDLTLTPEGLWLVAPDDPSLRQKVEKANLGAADIARNWAMLSGRVFELPYTGIYRSGDELSLSSPHNGLMLHCYIDGRVLVPWRYQLKDSHGKTQFSLDLDDYRMIGDLPYAHRLEARSRAGRVVVQLEDVELNTELAPGAFKPPRRAEKLP